MEGNKTDVLRPESSLPASRDDIKRALVFTAAWKLNAGLISEAEVDVYRASYMLLMNFVPDNQASRMREITEAAQAWKGSPNQSDELLAVALQMFSSHADLFPGQSVTTQGHALAKEFDDRFSQVMTAARTSHQA